MTQRHKWNSALLVTLGWCVVAACAGPRGAGGGRAKYPPRPPTCELMVFQTAAPADASWDDLGIAAVTCHLDIGSRECMQQFRAEACRMGADVVYGLPEKPLRPREYAMVFRARVGHTRAVASAPGPVGVGSAPPVPPTVDAAPPPPPPSDAAPAPSGRVAGGQAPPDAGADR